MRGADGGGWRVSGVLWGEGEARLGWVGPGGGAARGSVLCVGGGLAFMCGGDRRCVGVWRGGRRVGCPVGAEIAAGARHGQCGECQALDRSGSVAADTRPDDPRPFAVYLAHHGTAVKVGITGVERGSARLLEQGALASVVLSTGPLLAARRAEHVLGAALGLPDRVSTVRKRAARVRPAGAGERAAELLATAERAARLADWPQSQTRRPPQVTDHTAAYGLPPEGLRPAAAVLPLAPGRTVTGTVVCRIGSDLYLDTPAGSVLLDARLLSGWALHRPEPGAGFTAPLERLAHREEQDGLF